MNIDQHDKKCFIITPIGADGSEIRRKAEGVIDSVIVPVLCELGFKNTNDNIVVSHRISDLGSINKRIIEEIVNDELAIVNLTSLNPNVMYELAVRHATGKPVVTIAEKGTNLPFDITDTRTLFYSNDMLGAHELKQQLKVMCEGILNDEPDKIYENPIITSVQQSSILESVISKSASEDVGINQFIINKLEEIEHKISNIYQHTDNNLSVFKNTEYTFFVPLDKLSINERKIIKETLIDAIGRAKITNLQQISFNDKANGIVVRIGGYLDIEEKNIILNLLNKLSKGAKVIDVSKNPRLQTI